MSYAAVVNGGSPIGNIFDRSLTGGFLVYALFTPILTLVLTLESKGRAVCGNAARTDLRGGRWETVVPTATIVTERSFLPLNNDLMMSNYAGLCARIGDFSSSGHTPPRSYAEGTTARFRIRTKL